MTDEPTADAQAEASKLQADTLRGNIRDAILTEFKHCEKPWAKCSENEQARLIARAEDIAGNLVRRSIDIVAERGLPALPIEVGKITVDGSACKGSFECYADDENLLRIRHLQGNRAMFVLASPARFDGKTEAPKPDNVGDLAMPAEGRKDEDNLKKVGRGGRRKKKDDVAEAEADAAVLAAEGVAGTEPTPVDTSNAPFAALDDADELRVPADA